MTMIDWILPALFGLTLIVGAYIIHQFLDVIKTQFNPRAAEAERRQNFQLIQKLLEKRDTTDPMVTAQLHTQERIHEIQQASTTDRREIDKQVPAPIRVNDDEEPARHEYEAMYE